MRFSSTFALAALPLLAVAQDPLAQFQELAQTYLAKFQSYIPNPSTFSNVEAAAAKAAGKNIDFLSIDNWQETLQGPAEWWVLVTGRNKTCFGLCDQVETAFNETAVLFKVKPDAPRLATVNCDQSPVLCNSWSAGPPYVWVMEVGAPGAPVPIHKVRLNTTSTTVKTFTDLHETKSWKAVNASEGYFHPFNSQIHQLGLSKPVGYVLWVFSVVPSWMFMIGISFISRTFMGRATGPGARGGPAAAAARPRGAPPGDAANR